MKIFQITGETSGLTNKIDSKISITSVKKTIIAFSNIKLIKSFKTDSNCKATLGAFDIDITKVVKVFNIPAAWISLSVCPLPFVSNISLAILINCSTNLDPNSTAYGSKFFANFSTKMSITLVNMSLSYCFDFSKSIPINCGA
ncbi:Uncharacterised protein [Chlamydia trachomatis]|nr:Uncharacterised protein [Chlamydia trachomatis]